MDFNLWSKKGYYENINGKNIFIIDEVTSDNTIVILHGFPSCSFDYWKVLPILSEKFRVIIHDHIGFGLSDKPKEYSYSLFEQADTALEIWKKLGLKNATLVAHDYGCSIATEIIARANEGSLPLNFQSAILGNGSILIDMAKLQLIQKLLRNQTIGPLVSKLSTKWLFEHSMNKLWSDKSKIENNDFDNLWKMIQFKDGMNRASQISQYLRERVQFKDRWISALQQSEIPIHFVWGEDDPIAILDMAETLHQLVPKSTLTTLSNVGHYPMLEAPKRWSSAVLTVSNNLFIK